MIQRKKTHVAGSGKRKGIPASRRTTAGFTLVETVIALLLLAMVMAGVYRTLTMAIHMRTTAHRHYLGVIIANNRIERAKNVGFSELPFLAEERVRIDEQGAPSPNGAFLRTTRVEMNHGGNPRLARMAVTVDIPAVMGRESRSSETVAILLTEYAEP